MRKHRIKEVKTAQQEIKKLEEESEELQKQLDELTNPTSYCEVCYKKIKGGDTYYATSREPDKKTCPTCYQDQIDKRLAEAKRKKKDLERESEEIKDIMDQAEQANLEGKIFVLSEQEKKLLGTDGVKIVEDGNNLVRKGYYQGSSNNQGGQNDYSNSRNDQGNKKRSDKMAEYLAPALIGGGIIIIIVYLAKSKKEKK